MPNWCNNFARVSHEDPAQIDKIMATEGTDTGILQTFLPCPKELTDTVSGWLGDGYAQELNEFKQKLNLKHFGAKDWYDWQVANWGTKWDISDPMLTRVDENTVEISFDTAWSPPTNAYYALQQMGFNITAYYYEPGMCFAGRWDDGIDECYSDWGDAQGAKDTIPGDIDEMFGISESQAEYEEEERREEDLYRFTKEGAEKKGLITE